MANIAYDPNKKEDQPSSSNVLSPSSQTSPEYVSNGNPYGEGSGIQPSFSTQPQQQQTSQNKDNQVKAAPNRKQNQTASSGYVNASTLRQKNLKSAQQLGQSVEKKLTSTADLINQNTQNVNKQFSRGVEAGSIGDYQNALGQAKQGIQEASRVTAPTQTWKNNQATRYNPTKQAPVDKSQISIQGDDKSQPMSPSYSLEDQALIDSGKARVRFGDGTSKDFDTELEATNAIEEWNRLNPGYYSYGDQQQLSVGDDRLKEILNAKYSGPTELYQTAGYSDLANQVQEGQVLQDQALGSGYKGELLRQTFSNPNINYNQGQKWLDDLLLGSSGVSESLKQTAKGLGTSESGRLADDLKATIEARRTEGAAQNRLMEDIRKGSREELDRVSGERASQVESRLSDILANWEKYPQYFRDAVTSGGESAKQTEEATQKYNAAKSNVDSITAELNKWKSRAGDTMRWGTERPAKEIAKLQQQLNSANKNLTDAQKAMQNTNSALKEGSIGLSQLEAEMLGIKGGEGLYNLLDKYGVEELFKTAQADKNKLISRDEQNQLARLQGIAELAEDYGSQGSGINFRNQYTDRDVAGTQNALSALDMDNFTKLLQGAESDFRKTMEGKDVVGYGKGKATSGGAFGTKKKTAEQYLRENMGDLLSESNAYRNMYADEGVNQENINKILGLAKGVNDGSFGSRSHTGLDASEYLADIGIEQGTVAGDAALVGRAALGDFSAVPEIWNRGGEIMESGARKYTDALDSMYDTIGIGDAGKILPSSLIGNVYAELGRGVSNIGKEIGGALFGSSAGLKEKAQAKANAAAVADLKNKINQTLNNQGYSNQFNVLQDQERDIELLKLLGMLDQTNAGRR